MNTKPQRNPPSAEKSTLKLKQCRKDIYFEVHGSLYAGLACRQQHAQDKRNIRLGTATQSIIIKYTKVYTTYEVRNKVSALVPLLQ